LLGRHYRGFCGSRSGSLGRRGLTDHTEKLSLHLGLDADLPEEFVIRLLESDRACLFWVLPSHEMMDEGIDLLGDISPEEVRHLL
jgi:hypothetical protein